MNQKLLLAIVLLSLGLLVSACGAGASATATPEAAPTVVADDTIIAEGRVEPIHYAEIAFNASGTNPRRRAGESSKAISATRRADDGRPKPRPSGPRRCRIAPGFHSGGEVNAARNPPWRAEEEKKTGTASGRSEPSAWARRY